MNFQAARAKVALVIASGLFGLEWFFVNKLTSLGFNPLAITAGIVVFAWLGLSLWAVVGRKKIWPEDHSDRKNLIWLGVVYSGNAFLFFAALAKGQVASVLLLNYLGPIWTMLLARLFLREKITRAKVLSLVLVIGGLLIAYGFLSGYSTGLASLFSLANFLALLAGLFSAIRTIISSKINRLSEVMRSYWMLLISSLILSAASLAFLPGPMATNDWLLAVGLFLALGVGIQMVSLLLVQYALNHLEASVVGILLLLKLLPGSLPLGGLAGSFLRLI